MGNQIASRITTFKARWAALAVVIATVGLGGIGIPAMASAGGVSTTASCSISSVPKTVTSGTFITPTITVNNSGNTPFTTTVDGVQSEISKAGSKGGGFEQQVTVPANSSVSFQGGTTETQAGYKFKVVAKSTNPKFNCRAVAKVD